MSNESVPTDAFFRKMTTTPFNLTGINHLPLPGVRLNTSSSSNSTIAPANQLPRYSEYLATLAQFQAMFGMPPPILSKELTTPQPKKSKVDIEVKAEPSPKKSKVDIEVKAEPSSLLHSSPSLVEMSTTPQPKKSKVDIEVDAESPSLPHSSSSLVAISPTSDIEDHDPDSVASTTLATSSLSQTWMPWKQETWCHVQRSSNGASLRSALSLQVTVDKGLKMCTDLGALIGYTKNHFQLSVSVGPGVHHCAQVIDPVSGVAHEVLDWDIDVRGLRLVNSKESFFRFDQATTDRSKTALSPVPILKLVPSASRKRKGNSKTESDRSVMTLSRLLFRDCTANNQKKNSEQSPFTLLVTLSARIDDGRRLPVQSVISPPLVVRSSVSCTEESAEETEQKQWSMGNTKGSVHTVARVGVNERDPGELLVVRGNLKISGTLFEPSDSRVKESIVSADTAAQLAALTAVPVYHYRLKQSWADSCGRTGSEEADECGVLAQELEAAVPNAVVGAGDHLLADGSTLPDLRVVNKSRLYMESVGAVQELATRIESLCSKIAAVEARRAAVLAKSSLARGDGTFSAGFALGVVGLAILACQA